MARPDGPLDAGRDEGTPQSGARRLPENLKLPTAWRA